MRSRILALTLLALVAGSPALAGDYDHGKSDGKGHSRRAFCPHCGEACYPTVTKEKETKTCFDTEVKTICIPKVRFPWQGSGLNLSFRDHHGKGKGKGDCMDCPDSGCDGKGGKDGCGGGTICGRTKDVNVLMVHEYECTVCKYSWDPSGFKNDSKKDGKYLDAPEPATGEPAAPVPPSVEARSPAPRSSVRPISAESRASYESPEPAAKKTLFSSFFK